MALTLAKLEKLAEENGITRIPIQKTLNIYGLTRYEWLHMLHSQGWACGCCRKRQQLWNIDHYHKRGWKKLPPEERKKWVRGILCWHCNKTIVGSQLSAADGKNIHHYLRQWEIRKARLDLVE